MIFLFLYLCIHSFICLFACLLIYWCSFFLHIYWFIDLLIYWFNDLFIHLFFYSFIYLLFYFFLLLFPRSGRFCFCSNLGNFSNKRFVISQCRNEVFLHFWISCYSCPPILVKVFSSAVCIWCGKLKKMAGLVCFYPIPLSLSLQYSFLFPVINVAIFFTLGYLDKKFVLLWHRSLQSQTDWENISYVVGDYNHFAFFNNIPKDWSWGVLFATGIKVLLRRIYHFWFLVCIF